MTKDIAKIIGYPAFVILGAVAVDWSTDYSTGLSLCAIVAYFFTVFLIAFDPALLRVPRIYLRLSLGLPALFASLLHVLGFRVLGSPLIWFPYMAIWISFFVVRQRDPWWKAQEERAYNRVFGQSRSDDL